MDCKTWSKHIRNNSAEFINKQTIARFTRIVLGSSHRETLFSAMRSHKGDFSVNWMWKKMEHESSCMQLSVGIGLHFFFFFSPSQSVTQKPWAKPI